jgi:AcrR family transcriptional regulator
MTERRPLTRERVIGAAVALADEEGIDAVSMRRVGQSLGVEAMSLYNHVDSKDDLVAGMVDSVAAAWRLPSTEGPWREELESAAESAARAIVAHPWAATLMLTPDHVGPARLGFMDAVLAVLRESGFSAEMVHLAFHALDSHIVSTALRAAAYDVATEDEAESGRAFIDTLPAGAYPYLVEHIEWHAIAGEAEYTEFEFGLKLILDALERSLGET